MFGSKKKAPADYGPQLRAAEERLRDRRRKLRDYEDSVRGRAPDPYADRYVINGLRANIVTAEQDVRFYRSAR